MESRRNGRRIILDNVRDSMYRLFDTYGEYVPGFFKISLNKDLFKGIKWTDFDDEEKATLEV